MAQHIREPDGALIARLADEDWKLYHFDALGNTMAITDSQGAVTDRYDYDAWGEVYTDLMQNQTPINPYRYVGELGYHYFNYWMCDLPHLLQLGVRFYEPGVGRFGQRDPAPTDPGKSTYTYASDMPARAVDPSGLTPYVSPDAFLMCKLKGGNVYEYGTWHRRETHLDKWGFAKCLGKSCWSTGVTVAACAWVCKGPPQQFVGCFAECVAGDPSFTADIEAILNCYKQNVNEKTVAKTIYACSLPGGDLILDEWPPSEREGWVRD